MNVELSSGYFHQIKPQNVKISSGVKAVPENASFHLSFQEDHLWPLKLSLSVMKNINGEEDLVDSLDLDGEIHWRALPALEVDLKAALGAHSNIASWQEQIVNGVVKIIAQEATLEVHDLDDDLIELEVAFWGLTIGGTFDGHGIKDLFAIVETGDLELTDDEKGAIERASEHDEE
jgi:hypothetical protein